MRIHSEVLEIIRGEDLFGFSKKSGISTIELQVILKRYRANRPVYISEEKALKILRVIAPNKPIYKYFDITFCAPSDSSGPNQSTFYSVSSIY